MGPLQLLRMMSMSVAGSERVEIAHITSVDIRVDDVFQDRSIRYERGSKAARLLLPLVGFAHQRFRERAVVEIRRHPEGQKQAPPARRGGGQNAIAGRVVLDLVEHERGSGLEPGVELGDGAELEVPIRSLDRSNLPHLLHGAKPTAQIGR